MKAVIGQELLDDDLGLVQMVGEGTAPGIFVVKHLEGSGDDVTRKASVQLAVQLWLAHEDAGKPVLADTLIGGRPLGLHVVG
eukprot:1281485-Pleurochrysis_carterae.AAC.1